jgi:CxxC-x17-CxxC domain-containing protein
MPFTDRELECADCGATFTHSAGAQEKFAALGFQNDPKRCAPCRAAKKARSGPGAPGDRPETAGPQQRREMHTAVCAGCGGEARVPFKPTGQRPVYCSSCFETNRPASR